jgi:hypothetical protein
MYNGHPRLTIGIDGGLETSFSRSDPQMQLYDFAYAKFLAYPQERFYLLT